MSSARVYVQAKPGKVMGRGLQNPQVEFVDYMGKDLLLIVTRPNLSSRYRLSSRAYADMILG